MSIFKSKNKSQNYIWDWKTLTITFKEGTINIAAEDLHILNGIWVPKYRIEIAENILLPESIASIGAHSFKEYVYLRTINIPTSVKSIGEAAFCQCRKLRSIHIPEGVISIKNETFSGCKMLSDINIPESVTEIENFAFSGCSSLKYLTLHSNVKSIVGYAFKGCSDLTIRCPKGSYAEIYAKQNNIPVIYTGIESHIRMKNKLFDEPKDDIEREKMISDIEALEILSDSIAVKSVDVGKQHWVDNIANKIWVMKSGDKIPFSCMRDSHINNCIKMLMRKPEYKDENSIERAYVKAFKAELAKRKEKDER